MNLHRFNAQRRFEPGNKQLHFGGHAWSFLGRVIHRLSPHEYEKYWAFIFRSSTVEIHLRVIKNGAKTVAG